MEKPQNSSDKKGISPVKTLAAIIFGVVYIGILGLQASFPALLPIALTFLIVLAGREYMSLVSHKEIKVSLAALLCFSLYAVWMTFFTYPVTPEGEPRALFFPAFHGFLFLALLVLPFVKLVQAKEIPNFTDLFATLFGFFYFGVLFSFFVRLFFIGGVPLLGLLTVLTWGADVGAYLVGVTLKGPKLSPVISPGKTWSGALGGLLFAIIAGYLFMDYFALLGDRKCACPASWCVSTLAFIAALGGDLFESAMKRHFGVKDTGGLIPEHGGIMDRFDSMLFVAPVLYILFS